MKQVWFSTSHNRATWVEADSAGVMLAMGERGQMHGIMVTNEQWREIVAATKPVWNAPKVTRAQDSWEIG